MAQTFSIDGIFNPYSITPRNISQYKAYRGVTDFSQIGQFNQYESGYQFLSVLQMPTFITKLGEKSKPLNNIINSFQHMLEYEFRGMDGLPDLQGDTFEITDGINTQRMINRVTRDTSVEVSMQYFEKSGGLIEKFSEYYLTGIKDPMTQAKTYHGLIANDDLDPGLENEVFTMMYYVTDNTMLRLERAVLLANCQLTRAESSMYNGSRDNISNKEMTISFNCFPIWGMEVDKAANYLLKNITSVGVTYNQFSSSFSDITYNNKTGITADAALDSADYRYAIMRDKSNNDSYIADLYNAIEKA